MINLFDFSILVVGKENQAQEEMVKFLQELYAKVYVADNSLDGFNIFKNHSIDIVILDILGSECKCLKLVENMRQIDEELSIVITYPVNEVGFFPKSVQLNVNRYLSKPLDKNELIKIVHSFYNEKKSQSDLTEQTKLVDEYKNAIDESFIVSKTNRYGYITHVNDNFCKISGYTRDELIGQPQNIVKHPETNSKVFKDLWETIQAKKVWRGRIKNLNKNGKYYVVESVISPILDGKGKIKEFIAVRQDVTGFIKAGRKVIEKEKEKKEMEKEHYRELNQAKDSFLVVFTHELKTPLNAIINFSASAAKRINKIDSPRKDSLIEMMQVIKENGEDMLSTVTNILDLSRLKANRLEFNNSQFTLMNVINDLIHRFDSLIKEGEVNIDINPEHLNMQLNLDKMRTSQVISNILSNAIKYSNKEVRIYGDLQEYRLILTIEDNGPGIEDKEGIFDLYTQEDDDGIKRASKGTGVGLHFVKLLCEGMDIGLSLEDSQTLGGTKFIFTFKREDSK